MAYLSICCSKVGYGSGSVIGWFPGSGSGSGSKILDFPHEFLDPLLVISDPEQWTFDSYSHENHV